jgi:hypothetical protein
MTLVAIKEGKRASQLRAHISDGCMGALVVRSDAGEGTWNPFFVPEGGSIIIHHATRVSVRDNTLCENYPFALDDGTDVVLLESERDIPRALRRFDVDQDKVLAQLLGSAYRHVACSGS